MSGTSLVIQKNVGQLVPEDFLKKVVSEYKSWGGLAVVDGGELIVLPENTAQSFEDVNKNQKDNQDIGMFFVFGKEPKEYSADNVQPFVLLKDDKENPVLSVIISGEFSRFKDEKSSQSNAYRVLLQVISPKIKTLNRISKGDLETIMSEIKEADFEKDIAEAAFFEEEPGMIAFVASSGTPISFTNGKVGEFPWGIVSNPLGFGEEEKKPSGARERLAALRAARSGGGTDTAIAAAMKTAQEEKKTEVPVTSSEQKKVMGRAPAGLSNNKARGWHQHWTMKAPPHDFANRPWVEIAADRVPQFLIEAKKNGWEVDPKVAAAEPSKASSVPSVSTQKKDADVKDRELLTADEKKNLLNLVKKYDINALEIIDPDDMEKEIQAEPDFCESTGGKIPDMNAVMKLPREFFDRLITDNPKAAKLLMRDLQYSLINLAIRLGEYEESGTVRKSA